jgi:N-acetylglucosaminyldiphosphoundecaprenol N-acetyl-beta-D-mannosaminyltransferase
VCSSDLRRLWRRYLRNNPLFVWHMLHQWAGLRRYTLEVPAGALPDPDGASRSRSTEAVP